MENEERKKQRGKSNEPALYSEPTIEEQMEFELSEVEDEYIEVAKINKIKSYNINIRSKK